MKGIGKKAVKFSLALALVLSIGLIPAMPTAQASVGNWVNVDFFNAYIYSTELDSVVYDASLPADTIVTGTGMNNPEEETPTGESVVGEASLNGGPLLTFTPGAVTVEGWETQDWRDGTEYIWDLYPIPENEGKGRSVAVAPEGASFQPGFTVNRSFSNPDDETDPDPTEFPDPGTYHQMLNINTTPKVPTNELVIIVNIPGNPLLTATITDATGDGITADNWSASGAQISIPGPTTGTIYSQTFTIEVEVYEGGVSFKPEMQVIAWHNVVAGGSWDTTVTRSMVLGTWTLGTWTWDTTPELYDGNWGEQLAKVVNFPGSEVPLVNRVHVAFETGQTYGTEGDVVDGSLSITQPIWINSHLNNQGDDTGADVIGESPDGGPLLYLNAENVITVDERFLISGTPPEDTEYIWGYPPVSPDNNQQGYAEIGDPAEFTTGFDVEREVDTTSFTSAGGTQYLILRVTPTESMARLNINGQANMSEQEIASIANVVPLGETPMEGINIHFEEHGFNIEVEEPDIGQLYEWQVTININPLSPEGISADIEYMPFIQVRNIVALGESGQELGDRLEQEDMTGSGTWSWEADGEYLWDWVKRLVKEANLHGYAQIYYQARDIATEEHFHLRSSEGLHLYEGAVVADGSPYITGNLFTFTHPGTPSWAEITSWSYVNDVESLGHTKISGSFTITVSQQPDFEFGNTEGTISFSFTAQSYAVTHPFCEECEPYHYNFVGPFQITGGTGFYEGISGSGTIGGTFHDHSWSGGPEDNPQEKWFDFVMIGKARFKQQ